MKDNFHPTITDNISSLPVLPSLREIVENYKLKADKSLGQHFLYDSNITNKIVRASGDISGCTIIEVGPGPGGLTLALLASQAKHVIALEKDARFMPLLGELVRSSGGRLTVIHIDALQFDIASNAQAPRVVIANLPYNVGTQLLVGFLKSFVLFRSITVMLQLEVAQRLVAKPYTSAYGRLSVLCQAVAMPRLAFTVPARAFVPPPAVDSAVVNIMPMSSEINIAELHAIEIITNAAFGQRRKMLRSSLAAVGGKKLLNAANIDETRRAETLSVEEFKCLAKHWMMYNDAQTSFQKDFP